MPFKTLLKSSTTFNVCLTALENRIKLIRIALTNLQDIFHAQGALVYIKHVFLVLSI